MSTKVWLAKLGSGNVLAQEYYDESIIGVGWKITEELLQEIMDLQQKNRSKAVEILKENSNDPGGSLKRFLIDASEGDYITAGPVKLVDENNKLTKYFLIGKIRSKPYIPKRGQYDDSEYPEGINIVREVEWKAYEEEMPRGFKDYIGRNHHTFATAHNFDYKDIDILYKEEKISEFKKVEKTYMSYTEEILNYLTMMDPWDFETYIKALLEKNGWKVELTQKSRDGGIDLYGITNLLGNLQTQFIIQVKRYQGKINESLIKDFQELESPLESYQLKNPFRIFITTGYYPDQAKKQAANIKFPQVILIDGHDLIEVATHSSLIPGIHWFKDEKKGDENE